MPYGLGVRVPPRAYRFDKAEKLKSFSAVFILMGRGGSIASPCRTG